MRRHLPLFLTLSLGLLAAPAVEAKKLTSEEALKRAFETPAMKLRVKSQAQPRLAYTVNTSSNEEAVYVFNKGVQNGYLVLAADDEFPAVLGYADSGSFSEANMPPALKWWLGEYAAKIASSRNNSQAEVNAEATEDGKTLHSDWEPIAPLVTSKWNQSKPYNLQCPTGTKTGTALSVTGCVATALAQVMYYHKWPAQGTGTNTYTYTRSDKTENTITVDFSEYKFDWDNMLDVYETNKYTDDQANAVAALMYACGVGVDMKYTATASSAQTINDIIALTTYFDYSKDMRFKYRDATSFSGDWEAAIYESLKNKMPVIYSGASDDGGHSFVCDGYDEDGYFHFNWGWGGSSDGYFRLDLLNPDDQGIGGSGAGYNGRQMVILNIHPATADDKGTSQPGYVGYKGDFSYGTYTKGSSTADNVWYVDQNGKPSGFYNQAPFNVSCNLGILAVDKDGKEYPIYLSNSSNEPYDYDLKPNYGKNYMNINVAKAELPAGTYTVYPMFRYRETGEIAKMVGENGWRQHLMMTVAEDGTYTVANPETNPADYPDVLVAAFRYQGEVYKSAAKNVTISFSNLSDTKDLYGGIWMAIYPKGEYTEAKAYGYIDEIIPAARNLSFSAAYEFNLEPGEYEVMFQNAGGEFLTGIFPLVISEGTEQTYEEDVRFESLTPLNYTPYEKGKTKINFVLKNAGTENIVNPKFQIAIFPANGGDGTGWDVRYNYTFRPNSRVNFGATISEMDLAPGDYYIVLYWYKNPDDASSVVRISSRIYVTVGYETSKVDMEKASLNVSVGETVSAVAKITPVEAANTIKWYSENPDVATVDGNGVITGVAEGTTTIVAYAPNGKFDKCEVTVSPKSGIEDIVAAGKAIKAVYTVDGAKVLDAPEAADLKKLDKGVYVVVTEDGSFKYVR